MAHKRINYETLLKVTKAMSRSRDPQKLVWLTVQSIKEALDVKGCALFLSDPKTGTLELAASVGLSQAYQEKGEVRFLQSIDDARDGQPVAIYDVMDDPRIQYPDEARQESIASILAVPILVRGELVGAMRVYTADRWDFTLEDVNFVAALAQIAGMLVDVCRLYQGQNELIDVLTAMRDAREM